MGATFSDDRSKRYFLRRGIPPEICFVMLNPSKADEWVDDPTVRKCRGFAKRWGYGGIVVVNLIPTIATDPSCLPAWSGIDQQNSTYISQAMKGRTTVVAWGGVPRAVARTVALAEHILNFRKLLPPGKPLFCIGVTAKGNPLHPSRASYTEAVQNWEWT